VPPTAVFLPARVLPLTFQHSHEMAKLVGSPPGYVGHRETHSLRSQEALDQHQMGSVKLSFVLFDEIEKDNDAL
jgi:ATP-dependent Clp protease ATP-binding subunit ClpB